MVLEGRAHMLTRTSRCQRSWKAASIPLKRDEERGAEKAWVTSATDTDLIRRQGLPRRAHPPWRTNEGEFGLIQQLCLSSTVVPSVCFQQSANTSVFVFASVRLQVNDSVLTLPKQRPISVLTLTSLRCSHHHICCAAQEPSGLHQQCLRETAFNNKRSPSLQFSWTIFTPFYYIAVNGRSMARGLSVSVGHKNVSDYFFVCLFMFLRLHHCSNVTDALLASDAAAEWMFWAGEFHTDQKVWMWELQCCTFSILEEQPNFDTLFPGHKLYLFTP